MSPDMGTLMSKPQVMSSEQVCDLCNEGDCNFITGCYHHFHKFCLRYLIDDLEPGKCPFCYGPMTFSLPIETAVRDYKEGKVQIKDLSEEKQKAIIKVIFHEKNNGLHELLEACFKIDSLQTFCFQEAALTGNFEAVKRIIKWSDENNKKWESVLILEKCRESNDENLFNYVLKNIKDSHSSDGISSSDMFECFGFSVSPKTSRKVTPFLLACSISNVKILNELIKSNPDIVEARDQESRTAFHYAARNSFNPDVIDFIDSLKVVSMREEGNHKFLDEVDYTKEKSDQIILKLIKIGAAISVPTSVLKAVEGKNLKCLKILIENGAKLKGEHEQLVWYKACSGQDVDIIKYLIEKGYDINQKLKLAKNMTGLIFSVYISNFDSLKVLIELGADLKSFDDYGRDAIHTACYVQNLEIVEYFLSLGLGLVNNLDKNGNNLIHQTIIGLYDSCSNRWANCPNGIIEMTRKKAYEIISKLIDKIDLNAVNFKGEQSIHLLCEYSHMDLLELFHSKGAKINSTDSKGRNLAHLACKHKSKEEFLKKIIEFGVDLEAIDNENKIPADYCDKSENIFNILNKGK